MADLSVQQLRQVDTYVKTHKNVSREQAINLLFHTPAKKTNSSRGLKVEKSTKAKSSRTSSSHRTSYKLDVNSAKKGQILADKLYNQIQGASINANTIKLLKQITPENVLFVLDAYNKKTKGKESLAQAIDNEWGLDSVTVKEYLCPALVKLAKSKNIQGVYYGDYMKKTDIKSLNEWISNASTKMKSSLGINLAGTTVLKKTSPKRHHTLSITAAEEKNLPNIYRNSLIKQQGIRVGKKIYNQIKGLSNPLKTSGYLDMVNEQNVYDVMKTYEKQSKGKETLIDGIADEYGLNYRDVKRLGVKLSKYGRANGVKIDDLVDEFNSADNINSAKSVTKKIYARINSAKITKDVSLAKYADCFGYGKDLFSDFEKKTGVSLETAILLDPTISKDKKIDLIRNNFTKWHERAVERGVNVDDIIKNANDDLQALNNDNNFSKYSDLYKTTIKKLRSRCAVGKSSSSVEVNGKIDKNYEQGRTGDCWLLASIKGIARNPKGLKILNDSIKVNSNGSVTVHLKGVDKTYVISKKELNNATELSSGDGDVRALEIAVNRYLREDYKYHNGEDASIDGNREITAYKILTGKSSHFFPLDSNGDHILNPEFYGEEPISDDLIDEFNDKDKITCVSSHGDKKEIQVNTSSNTKGRLVTKHAYNVSHADKHFVYLINPWDTSVELKVDRKTFKSFFTHVDSFSL